MLRKRSRRLFATLRGLHRRVGGRGRLRGRLQRAIGLTDWGHGFAGLAVTTAAAAGSILVWAAGAHAARDVDLIAGRPADIGPLDWMFIGTAGATLVLGALLARRAVFDRTAHRLAAFGLAAAVVAIWSEMLGVVASGQRWPAVGQAAGVIAICSAVPAAITAATGMLLVGVRLNTTARLAVERRTSQRRGGPDRVPDTTLPDTTLLDTTMLDRGRPAPVASAAPGPAASSPRHRARWTHGYRLAEDELSGPERWTGTTPSIGIGLSGGGIRAASVMLGALQDPTFREQALLRARYLVSVSGGGYTAGAYVQALTGQAPPTDPHRVIRDPRTAFAEGTAEEDHVRRHASYIARNASETLAALAVLGRHLVLNLILLFGPAIGLGVLAACFYRAIPLAALEPVVQPTDSAMPQLPTFVDGVWFALLGLTALAGAVWLLGQWTAARLEGPDNRPRPFWVKLHHTLTRVSPAVRLLLLSTLVLTLGVPMVIWTSQWVLRLSPFGSAVPASIGTVLLTYAASLAALVWRKRANLKATADSMKVPAAVPRGFGQLLLVVVALTVLTAGWLLVLGGTAVSQITPGGDGTAALAWGIGILILVIVLGGLTDETTLSLHPFYRRRLARAFAVRSVRRTDGTIQAEPYRDDERTTLSTYGTVSPDDGAPFPEVIFACSATLGGTTTPPGSDRVSYTFSSRAVGGPDVGYYPTDKLIRRSSARLRRDLTVQGAVALSGAAIAASVGSQNTKWYETLFAVTGVRLGAWMPNPAFLVEQEARGGRRWYEPDLPRVRRMSYLLRELFGLHPADAPLVQVTDGGFYDNLGLIELLRRRCTTIYCIDASGDNPPPAATLAEVVSLAYQELGVEIDLRDTPYTTTPGTGDPKAPRDALTSLNPRLSSGAVMTATISYPPESGLPAGATTGTLVVAKASLWPELPYPLLAYALRNPVFPNDSSGDQWFDDGQYGAYTALGRELGAAAIAAATAPAAPPARPVCGTTAGRRSVRIAPPARAANTP